VAESCPSPSTTYGKLAWPQAWDTRDKTYSTALAERVNTQYWHPFDGHWRSSAKIDVGKCGRLRLRSLGLRVRFSPFSGTTP